MPKKNKKTRRARTRYYDYNLVAIVVLLTCFGLVMLYSTSAYTAQVNYENDMQFFGRQAAISIVSILIALFISRLDYHILYYISGAIYVASMILMLLVKFSPLGREVNGARRWLTIIPGTSAQLQPSELAKIAAITFIPCLIIKMGKQVKTLRGSLFLLCTGGILAMGAFQLTENLSTGIIIGAITVLMIFIAHPKTRPFIIGAVVLAVLVVVGRLVLQWVLGDTVVSTENLSSFRLERILVWLNPEQYSSEGGYQIMQALYAIGSGGFFGKGLGNSVQKLGPVPEAQNDMIFSIVCEELGVFGGLVVLILFGYLLYRLFFIAENAPDFYGSLVVGGIMIHIALQVILNICVVLNWIPTTGITLPFISYGGTSILFLMLEMGIALSVSRQIKFAE
ncbi:MAG TPA: putative lipid II flippase FtsW [Candidatus Blautia avicola]|uniref:Probable peptidoglycan glycosyltransferase FtsW n=1 Tax=Candidatus Blautia avicola TaxID=2838483 RepID=A0A9D2QX45_9FIRM|nr:putative lipid II flippase FtsW [Candidatus Blautia avicola]